MPCDEVRLAESDHPRGCQEDFDLEFVFRSATDLTAGKSIHVVLVAYSLAEFDLSRDFQEEFEPELQMATDLEKEEQYFRA